ncbi:MAG TPA: T9SS type A sorting domain-containing protein, partial [Bacteroidales bacterium]|nr:T9SS type A sorting domain-containing protein [Bacteroidales bacterium]
ETSGMADNWNGALTLAGNIFNALECGNASAWVFWSFDVSEGSAEYGLVVSNKPSSRYFVSKQYYKFIRPGAIRVDATSDGIPAIAFKHPDNDTLAVVLFNNTNQTQTIEIKGKGLPTTWDSYTTSQSRNFEQGEGVGSDGLIVLPPSSLTTLVGVNSNPAPNIDPVANLNVGQGTGEQMLTLTGIDDGEGYTQNILITASSSNTDLVPDPTVDYTQGEANATLSFTPSASLTGTAVITVTLTDDGEPVGENVEQFTITVGDVNGEPTIDAVSDMSIDKNAGEQTVNLTGIDDGDGFTQNLTITATSDNTDLIPDPVVTYIQGESTATLTFTPAAGIIGDAMITINVSDDGDPVKAAEVQFNVSVIETGITSYSKGIPLYPNPVNSLLNIDLSGHQFTRMIVTDLSGRPVMEKSIENYNSVYRLDISGIEKGMYILLLKNDKESIPLRFVIE